MEKGGIHNLSVLGKCRGGQQSAEWVKENNMLLGYCTEVDSGETDWLVLDLLDWLYHYLVSSWIHEQVIMRSRRFILLGFNYELVV